MSEHVLVVDDDPVSNRILTRFLALKGYQTSSAQDGNEALHSFLLHNPDAVILDVNMPTKDGITVLKELRSMSDVPIIMVTVRDGTEDKVQAFDIGADDYVTKPFELEEISARLQAVMRRSQAARSSDIIRIGVLTINDRTKQVTVNGTPVNLTRKEYELLLLLAKDHGRVFSSQEILQTVWSDRADEEASEDVKKYVYLLRTKLEEHSDGHRWIETVRGFGYRLATPDH